MKTATSTTSTTPTSVWVLVAGLVSTIMGLVAAILKATTGAGWADAALSGGAAFATTMLIGLGVIAAMRPPR